MNKLKACRSVLLLLGLMLAFTAPPALAAQALPACEDPASSLLWHIERGERDIYLFGSIHVGKAGFYPLPDPIETAFDGAEHLVFEVDPRSAADPAVAMRIQRRGMLPAGQTLEDVVSPQVMADLRAVLARTGMPEQAFLSMRPWFLNLVLNAMQMTMNGYSPQHGIELYLLSNKPADTDVLELESIAEQIEFLQELNAESFLAYTLESFGQSGTEIEAMMRAWQCADKEALQAMLFEEFSEDPVARADMERLREKLFYQRNAAMAEDIAAYIDTGGGDYFVVVGAGHLLGERSVVDLLRRRGYQVSPVPSQP